MISESPRKTAKSKAKSKSKPRKLDTMDAKTLADVDKLVENIKNNVVTLLLIYADWCGHCGTFKDTIWKRLASLKGRKVPMAQINEKVLQHLKEKIPDLKIDGYPTVSLIGNDMKAAEVNDPRTGEKTHALPNTRDMASMTKLVRADPSQVVADNNMGSAEEPKEENKSAMPTAESLTARKEAGRNAIDNMKNGTPNISPDSSTPVNNPPNVEDDLVESQEPANTPKTASAASVGGSLYAALVAATRQVAVPAALTAVGTAISRRKKVRKGTRRH
jgi:hypothetical protein